MKISIYIAMSANGFISNSRNVPDWLSPEYGQGLVAICQKCKAVIMGRTTYDMLAPDHLPLQQEGTTVVLTTDQQLTSGNPTVLFTDSNASEIDLMLTKKGYDEAVVIGGGMIIREFIKAGLVDELYLVIEPVVFGSGLPIVSGVEVEASLKLLEVVTLNENTLQLHYELKKLA